MIHTLGRLLIAIADFAELVAFTAIMYPAALLPAGLRGWYPRAFQLWCRSFVRALGVDVRLHQHNEHPLPGRYILVANHPSAFEDVGIPALFPVRSLAKIELRDWVIAGKISEAAGTLYLKRDNPESRRAAREDIMRELAQGRSVCVFPEGGCMGRRIHRFHVGVFDIARSIGVPILPVFLHYEAQEDFEWQGQHLLVKLWQIRRARNRRANYHVFDAVDPTRFEDGLALCKHVQGLYLQWQARFLE